MIKSFSDLLTKIPLKDGQINEMSTKLFMKIIFSLFYIFFKTIIYTDNV